MITATIILKKYVHNISFSTLSNKYRDFLNIGLIFTPEVFIKRKKAWERRVPGVVNFDILF